MLLLGCGLISEYLLCTPYAVTLELLVLNMDVKK